MSEVVQMRAPAKPLHDLEAERAVLAAFLADPKETWTAIGDAFSPEAFYLVAHQNVARIVAERCAKGLSCDPITVRGELLDAQVEGADTVLQIAKAYTAGDVAAYWSVILRLADKRHSDRDIALEARAKAALDASQRPCSIERLRERQQLRFIPLGDLPDGHGWGDLLDQLTGGGLVPGSVVGLGAGGTGAGKTAFLMQVLDGLAMRCALIVRDADATVPLTPIAIFSEMAPEDLECRTLGRLLDVPGTIFAAGRSAKMFHNASWVDAQYDRAAELMRPGGVYAELSRWQRIARPLVTGAEFVQCVEAFVDSWLAELRKAHPGRELVPIIAVDPINRFLPPGDEVEGLDVTSDLLNSMADRRRWIVCVTSDTNKTSAKEQNGNGQNGASVFRGTMQFLHAHDLTLVLTPSDEEEDGISRYTVSIDKNRNGPKNVEVEFQWHRKTGLRFVAETEHEWKKRRGAAARAEPPAISDALRLAVVREVAKLVQGGVPSVSRNSMRRRAKDLWRISQDKLDVVIDAAILAGELTEERRAGQGGGKSLLPTGKSLDSGSTAEVAEPERSRGEPPATSRESKSRTPAATSRDFRDFPVTPENDSGKQLAIEVAETEPATSTDSERPEPGNSLFKSKTFRQSEKSRETPSPSGKSQGALSGAPDSSRKPGDDATQTDEHPDWTEEDFDP